jgi:hypothetical protein
MQSITFAVSEVAVKDTTAEGRKAVIVLKSAGPKGASQIKIQGQPDLADYFQVGQFHEVTLKEVPAPV